MDTIQALQTRQSAGRLGEPAPPPDVLEVAFQCAMAAPDHGRLRPARFIVVEGEGREKLGGMLAESLRRRKPDSPPDELERASKKALRAPMIIVAVCSPQEGKIPLIEQMLSVGASVENLLLALHAQGYGAMWRTGDAAYDEGVKRGLGIAAADHIIGFVYAGTPLAAKEQGARAQPPNAIRHLR